MDLAARISLEYWLEKRLVETYIKDFSLTEENADVFFKENILAIWAKPFIKWVWGKRQLLKQFQSLYPTDYNNYFEPFAGGGAVFLDLQKKNATLCDINTELVNSYNVIKNSPNDLISFLKTLEFNKETYETIRAWDREENWKDKHSEIERAWRFMYLNRTCFNGLYRVSAKGYFNVPMWKYENPDYVQETNITNLSKLLNTLNTTILNTQYKNILDSVQSGDFVYLDPPYDTIDDKNSFTSYNENSFGKKQQEELAEFCKELNNKWAKFMLSNHDTPFIQELYKEFNISIVKASRAINSKGDWRGKINEVVVRNF